MACIMGLKGPLVLYSGLHNTVKAHNVEMDAPQWDQGMSPGG